MWWWKKTGVLVAAFACLTVINAEDVVIRPTLPAVHDDQPPAFTAPRGVDVTTTGTLQWGGPMALSYVMTFWAEGLQTRYPGIVHHIEPGRDQEIWPPTIGQLINGYGGGNLVLGSDRILVPDELMALAKEVPGQRLLEIPIGIEAIAVIVHRDNPLTALMPAHLDAVFSAHRRRGHPEPITHWSDLGVAGFVAELIQPVGRNRQAGRALRFSRLAMDSAPFVDGFREFTTDREVVQAVASQPAMIGCAAADLLDERVAGPLAKPWQERPLVRVVPLLVAGEAAPVMPTRDDVLTGVYPLRTLFVLRFPLGRDGLLSATQRLVVRWVASREGQEAVVRMGYLPLPASWLTAISALVE